MLSQKAKKVFDSNIIAKLEKISESHDVVYENSNGKKTLFIGFDGPQYARWQKCNGDRW